MSCAECRSNLLPWLKNELTEARAEKLEQHLVVCKNCAMAADSERLVLGALRNSQSIPSPSSGFESRVLGAATGKSDAPRQPQVRRSWSTPVFGGAIAAALVLGLALGIGLQSERPIDSGSEVAAPEEPGVQPVPRNVRLAFSSSEALEDVTLTLELPPHVEMSRYPGHQQLSWKVDLDKGENVVNLPLNILFPGQGDLVAHIDDGRRRKTFRTSLDGPGQAVGSEPSS